MYSSRRWKMKRNDGRAEMAMKLKHPEEVNLDSLEVTIQETGYSFLIACE
jgi:hypothetical protein